ncbi:hypothetical protein BGX33_008388 [Mortierella sp. NVP41]|nr:hypothetical protein BGX33_008388 [Mortierella sp. NVP41]
MTESRTPALSFPASCASAGGVVAVEVEVEVMASSGRTLVLSSPIVSSNSHRSPSMPFPGMQKYRLKAPHALQVTRVA